MGIGYFPTIYEDELIYSVLARFYAHSGYLSYNDVSVELFSSKKVRPDKEFIKKLQPEILKLLTKQICMEEVIEKHTMFPFYGRFIDKKRKSIAFNALISMSGDFSKLLGAPQLKREEKRYFKYCPLCAKADREKYGETYWHRIHQIRKINVCTEHKCYLADSSIALDSKTPMILNDADAVIPLELGEISICNNSIELKVAEYMIEVFNAPLDRNNEMTVSNFLHSKMAGTNYLSYRGEHCYYSRLSKNMQESYHSILSEDNMKQHVQRILLGTRIDFFEICLIAMFLDISADALVRMDNQNKMPEEVFDEKVRELINAGKSINEAAREMNVNSSIIRLSLENDKKIKKKRNNRKVYQSVRDWEKLDKEMFPLVKKVIYDLQGNGTDRPLRISIYAVAKRLNLSSAELNKMNRCREEIKSHYENKEQYWARKVSWAIRCIKKDNKPILCWRITAIAKVEKEDIKSCLPYLEDKLNQEDLRTVKNMFH